MKIDHEQLHRAADEVGFQVESFEKVLQLVGVLDAIFKHPFLINQLELKGGTALNLFTFALPRLSVDIDLNYTGAVDRQLMIEERPKVDQAIQAVCDRLELQVRRMPSEHAGGKCRLTYERSDGGNGNLELDLNFILREGFWPSRRVNSPALMGIAAEAIPVQNLHELAGGKLAALFSRNASRDLFDAVGILESQDLDWARLRFAFLAYGGMNRKDWREISISHVQLDQQEAERKLLPMLRHELRPARRELGSWCDRLQDR